MKLISSALIRAGLSYSNLLLALSQIAHESGGFNNKKIQTHNNPSGITYNGQKNATRGNVLPETIHKSKKYYYAKFNTLNDWAKYYIKLVGNSLKQSTTPKQFAENLKSQGYYQDPVGVYSDSLTSAAKNILSIATGQSSRHNQSTRTHKIIKKSNSTKGPIVLFILFGLVLLSR
jgi:hypothetical protein